MENEGTKTITVKRSEQDEDEVQNYTYVEVTRSSHGTQRENNQSRLKPRSTEAAINSPDNVTEEKKGEESYYEI